MTKWYVTISHSVRYACYVFSWLILNHSDTFQRSLIDTAAKIQKENLGPKGTVKTNSAPSFPLPPQTAASTSQTMPPVFVAQRETVIRPPTLAQDRTNLSATLISGVPPGFGNAPLVGAATYPLQSTVQNPSSSTAASSSHLGGYAQPSYPIGRPQQTLGIPTHSSRQSSSAPVNSFGAPPNAFGQPFLRTFPATAGAINNIGTPHYLPNVPREHVNIYLPGYSPYQLPLKRFNVTKLPDEAVLLLSEKPDELRALNEPPRSLLWFVLGCSLTLSLIR